MRALRGKDLVIHNSKKSINPKVCYINCYKDFRYTRNQNIVSALKKLDKFDLYIIKNHYMGIFSYVEILIKLIKFRLFGRADIYIIGFRGNEYFWLIYPFIRNSKIIFDEFIILHDWLVNEHKIIKENSILIKAIDAYMRWVMQKSSLILTDTQAHKKLCSSVYSIEDKKIEVLPVGADENLFYTKKYNLSHKGKLRILFYGNMLPLHGVDIILDAIKLLNKTQYGDKFIFTLIGGKGNTKSINKILRFIKENNLTALIKYKIWVSYDELPTYIWKSDICLGGPFGGTGQAGRVVTGKTYQFLAAGKPTIVGKSSQMREFKDKYSALIIKQNSAKDLALSLIWAINNRKELSVIGRNGRILYEKKFSTRKLANQINQILGQQFLSDM